MTSAELPIVSESLAEQVHRSGSAKIGEFTQARLLADGVRHADTDFRSSPTTFDQLDEAERAAEVERTMRDDPGDPAALELIRGVTASPLFSGSWNERVPNRTEAHMYLEGLDLPDGSPGVLVGAVDKASSRWHYTLHSLSDLSHRLAQSLFAIKDPEAPEESIVIANAGLGLVWPSGRWETRPREIAWLLACPSSGSRAHLQTSRNFGLKRSERTWKGLVSEDELRGRMLELFEQCAREGGRRR